MKVPGLVLHSAATAQLDAFLAAPAHAILLGGPLGSGKTHIGQALAMRLLHVSTLENHAYYRAVVPQKGSTSIEQIRTLNGFFGLKVPGTAAVKRVVIIEDADTMGTEAQNALLKLLEEPPADSVLILTSSQPERLLTTIRSRTQLLQLPAPDVATLRKHFAAAGHSEPAIAAALLRSGTNIAEASQILMAGAETSDATVNVVKQALGGTAYDRMLLVDGLAKQKDTMHAFADMLATIAMASLESAANKNPASVNRWKNVLQAAHTAQDALERSGNAKLVLTELMLAL